MTDIDVEPVDAVEDESDEGGDGDETTGHEADDHAVVDPESPAVQVDDVPTLDPGVPEYVLYGGKGGVGKTTMAAATALSSAASGERTLVVSTDPAHSLSDTFETVIGSTPERIREEIPLYAAEIDPDEAMESGAALFGGGADGSEGPFGGENTGRATDSDGPFGDGESGGPFGGNDSGGPFGGNADGNPFDGDPGGGPMGGLGQLLGGEDSPMEALLGGGAMPGADEAAAMQLLLQHLDDDRFDRVVVDTAPTGHTLRLLQLPEGMDTMVGRMLRLRERLSGMFEGLKGMFGGEVPDEDDGIDDLRELQDRIERLRATLTDPALTDFRIVMVPEEMSVMESGRLQRQLQEFEIPVETVVVNKVMEPLSDVADADGAEEFASPNLDDCAFCQRRWDVQQQALGRAQDLFQGKTVRRVPLLAEEVRGDRPLRIVARCLDV